jgi:hypothetical protein
MSRLERIGDRLRPAVLFVFMLAVFTTVSGGSSPGWMSRLAAVGPEKAPAGGARGLLERGLTGCPDRGQGSARAGRGTFNVL